MMKANYFENENTKATNEIAAVESTAILEKESTTRIYIRSERKWVTVDKEYFIIYMRDVGAHRKKQYRRGLCACPCGKEYMCDCDCLTCPFYRKDKVVSLDAHIMDDEGNEEKLMDRMVDATSLTPEEIVVDHDDRVQLYKAINQLSDEDQTLIRMELQEKSQMEIAAVLGLRAQTNVAKRKRRALAALKKVMVEENLTS